MTEETFRMLMGLTALAAVAVTMAALAWQVLKFLIERTDRGNH